jgi:hypothetical protein
MPVLCLSAIITIISSAILELNECIIKAEVIKVQRRERLRYG